MALVRGEPMSAERHVARPLACCCSKALLRTLSPETEYYRFEPFQSGTVPLNEQYAGRGRSHANEHALLTAGPDLT